MSDPDSNGNNPAPQPGSGSPAGEAAQSQTGGSAGDWREQRRAERWARRSERWNASGWHGFPIGGAIILVLGVVFLLGNFGFHLPAHWWAVLLLIPAVGLLVTAIRFYRADNTMGGRAMGPLIGGIVLLAMALAIFFGLNWGIFWPLVLIAVGLSIIARRAWR
ncbi:MAG TPA: hypothetical protein VHA07_05960 [Devosia sp.]|nr:hypothetical protein [Devosia sp.]